MPIIPINRLGEIGIVRDIDEHELALNAWSDGANVRFNDSAVEKMLGYNPAFGVPQIAPYALLPVQTPMHYYWIYGGLNKVHVVDEESTHANITRQVANIDSNYAANPDRRWNGGVLSGVPILNNGFDPPQMWAPIGLAQRLSALSNWPANTKAAVIRPFKQFLVAMNITKETIPYPRMVKWSHPADPGFVPTTWDETDETKDAGEYDLSETGDDIVDGLSMRDVFIIYKENSVYAMQFIGGAYIFRFNKLWDGFGAINTDCVTEYRRGRHLVFTGDDLIEHDGVQTQSVLDGRWRKWFRTRIDPDNFHRSFVVNNQSRNEVWLFFVTAIGTIPDTILIWNWKDNTLTWRTVTGFAHAAADVGGFVASKKVYIADPIAPRIHLIDSTNQNSGVTMTAFVERRGLGPPTKVDSPPDLSTDKIFRRLWPRIRGTAGGIVNVYLAVTNKPGETPLFPAEGRPYVIGTTESIDFTATGKLLNIRFESSSDIEWRLSGYELDLAPAGRDSH